MNGQTADWTEIANRLQAHIDLHGPSKIWIEWSGSNADYDNAIKGLDSVGKAHLLSSIPCRISPLRQWRMLRRLLHLPDLKLNLGNPFSVLFSEDSELLSRQHYADADVLMM